MTNKLHKQISSNNKGRDFIVGDLHGCLDLFIEKLLAAGFDTSCDRVFSVGDLIDRGPDSMGCLRLLREPWFHAVRGNHEQILIDYAYPYDSSYSLNQIGRMIINNGGDWIHNLSKEDQSELWDDLMRIVVKLPYVITVGEGVDKFHLVHAELITQGKYAVDDAGAFSINNSGKEIRILTDADINDDTLLNMKEAMTWGRRIASDFKSSRAQAIDTNIGRLLIGKNSWHEGLSLTYCGHTIINSVRLNRSHLLIDRGAYSRDEFGHSELLFLSHADVLSSLPARN